MSDPKQVGSIFKDPKTGDVYLVMEDDREVYFFMSSSFYFGLTKCADKGCNFGEVLEKMEQLQEAEDRDLGFV